MSLRARPKSSRPLTATEMKKGGYTYIIANDRPTLYTGVTNDLIRRTYEHKQGIGSRFTRRYGLKKLIYYEVFETIEQAIIREKQIKDMNRKDKIGMIKRFNPLFKDLYSQILDSLRSLE